MHSTRKSTRTTSPSTSLPLDADGNLPEGLDKDTYYDGFVEQAKEEKKQEEAAKKSKSDTSKDTKATKTSEKK